MRLNLYIVYSYLTCIERAGETNLTRLQRCGGGSMSTVSKYVEVLKAKGLIEEETRGRERVFKVTRKGRELLHVLARLLELVDE